MARKSISACSLNIDWPRNDTDPSHHCQNRKPGYKYYSYALFYLKQTPCQRIFIIFSLLYSHTFLFKHHMKENEDSKIFIYRLKSSRMFHVFRRNLKKHHFKKLEKGIQRVLPEEILSVGHPLQLAPKESSNFSSKLILGSPIHPLEVCFLCGVTQRTCSGACSLGWYWVVDNKSSTSTSALITAQF